MTRKQWHLTINVQLSDDLSDQEKTLDNIFEQVINQQIIEKQVLWQCEV